MKKLSAADASAAPKPGSLFREIRFHLGASVAVGLGTYVALAYGLGWLVVFAFGAGIFYAGWLLLKKVAPRRVPLSEREDLPADLELPAGSEEFPKSVTTADNPKIRARIMEELVWGKTDPETMEVAAAMAGPGGDAIPRYIELRMAQLVGSDESRAGEEPADPKAGQ